MTLTIHWLRYCCWLHHSHWHLSLPSLLSQGALEIVNSDYQRPFTLLCTIIVLFYNSEQGWHTQHSCMHFLQPGDRLRHFLPELVHCSVLCKAHRAAWLSWHPLHRKFTFLSYLQCNYGCSSIQWFYQSFRHSRVYAVRHPNYCAFESLILLW